jgi:putative transposase
MARKPRIEFEGACYHVINRGNYRSDVFATDKTKAAFEKCLFEACELKGWRLHAYAIMRNHFHLALETPKANLVVGMQWLQSTFASRFNKYRHENGHLFQGRYKSILVEPGYDLASVVNYIHLNPAEAGILPVADLKHYRWSSYRVFQSKSRPVFLICDDWLHELGGLTDTPAGWRSYQDYLIWLATDESEQKRQSFDKMCRGWAFGSQEWRKALLDGHAHLVAKAESCGSEDVTDMRETHWARTFEKMLQRDGVTKKDLVADKKGAQWKVTLAAELRQTTSATNRWIAHALHMGKPNSVSKYLSWQRYRKK